MLVSLFRLLRIETESGSMLTTGGCFFCWLRTAARVLVLNTKADSTEPGGLDWIGVGKHADKNRRKSTYISFMICSCLFWQKCNCWQMQCNLQREICTECSVQCIAEDETSTRFLCFKASAQRPQFVSRELINRYFSLFLRWSSNNWCQIKILYIHFVLDNIPRRVFQTHLL